MPFNKDTCWDCRPRCTCISLQVIIDLLLWDHMIKAQGVSIDPSWWLYYQLMGNVVVYWSKILVMLVVREPLAMKIKP